MMLAPMNAVTLHIGRAVDTIVMMNPRTPREMPTSSIPIDMSATSPMRKDGSRSQNQCAIRRSWRSRAVPESFEAAAHLQQGETLLRDATAETRDPLYLRAARRSPSAVMSTRGCLNGGKQNKKAPPTVCICWGRGAGDGDVMVGVCIWGWVI